MQSPFSVYFYIIHIFGPLRRETSQAGKWRRRRDLWHRLTAQHGEIHKHEVREDRGGKWRRERAGGGQGGAASERLSLIDKPSLYSGKPPISTHAHTNRRGGVCRGGEDALVVLRGAGECVFEMQSTPRVLGSSFCCKASLKRHLP